MRWLFDYPVDERQAALNDLLNHGCISGMVGGLIYYADTCRFYNKHRHEILAMVDELCLRTGETLQELLTHANNFPLGISDLEQETFVTGISGLIRKNADVADRIKNWFAWFAFEEAARVIYEEIYAEK